MGRTWGLRRAARSLGTASLLGALVLVSCDTVSVTSVGVASVRIEPASLEVVSGQIHDLSAVALDANGTTVASGPVQWSSSAPDVVDVSSGGVVTALAPGLASVTASVGGVVGTAVIAVSVPGTLALLEQDRVVQFTTPNPSSAPAARTVRIDLEDDGAAMGLTATVDYQSGSGWLDATLSSTKAPTDLRLVPDPSGLQAGTYRATVTVASPSATNGSVTLSVSLSVATPVIAVQPDSVHFTGSGNRSVAISNAGAGTLSGLSVQVEHDSGDPSGWLTASLGATTAPSAFTLSARADAVPAGRHTAHVRISSTSAHVTDRVIPVVLDSQGSQPVLRVSPTSLALSAPAGGIGTATVNLDNSGTGTLSGLTTAASYAAGQPTGWLQLTLSGSTAPATLTARAQAGSLAIGSYQASIEVGANAQGAPRFIPVTLTVTQASGQPPAAPTGLAAQAADSTTVQLDWTDGATTETSFEVERASGGGAFTNVQILSANTTAWTDTGLSPGTHYAYRVRACNTSGCSGWSNTGTATTPGATPSTPAPPTGLAAIASDTSTVDLTWTDASASETSFEVERATSGGPLAAVQTLPANTTAWTDTGLSPATDYAYRVRACNGNGCSAWSPEAKVSTPAPPAAGPQAPQKVSAKAISAIDVDVKWDDKSSTETHFELQRVDASGGVTALGTVPANTENFRDTGLTPGATYEWQVRACNGGACSAWSASKPETMPNPNSPPRSPSNLRVTSGSAQAVHLQWDDRSDDETYFQIEEGGFTVSWSVIGTAGVDVETFTDTQVITGSFIAYRVRACNPAGCSGSTSVLVYVP